MLMNETEAKAKWCPYSRSEGGLNRAVLMRISDGDVKIQASAGCCCITTNMAEEVAEQVKRTRQRQEQPIAGKQHAS